MRRSGPRGRNDRFRIRPRDGCHEIVVGGVGLIQFTTLRLEDAHGLVATAGSEPLAILAESQSKHPIRVLFNAVLLPAPLNIPNANDIVRAAGRQIFAIRAEGEAKSSI